MPSIRLTDRFCATVRPPAEARVEYWDTTVRGLLLRVGQRTRTFWACPALHAGGWYLQIKIGRYPDCSLRDARGEARTILGRVARGLSPRRRTAITFGDLADQYLENTRLRHPDSTDTELTRILSTDLLPAWRSRPAADVKRGDVLALLDQIQRRAASTGRGTGGGIRNRTRSVASAVFDHGVLLEVCGNPVKMIPKLKESPRERVLSDSEITTLWKHWLSDSSGPIYQLLLLTGQRRGEVTGMRWADIDQASWWTIPKELTKTGRANHVYLSPLAQTIIEDRERLTAWVFPGPGPGGKVNSMTAAHRRVQRVSGVRFRIHDLRRAAATRLVELGTSPRVVDEILNHRQAPLHYLRAVSYRTEVKAALTLWGEHLASLVQRGPRS